MVHSRTWTIEIRISEHDDEADRSPAEIEVRGNGEDLAVAHSLAGLAGKLFELTRDDVGQFTHGHGRLLT